MYSFFLSKNAKEDLWRIYEYGVYKFGTNKADEYFNLIQDCFDKIASNPFMFPILKRIIHTAIVFAVQILFIIKYIMIK